MKMINAHLRLSTASEGHTRERCPDVIFSESDRDLISIRTDTEQPELPLHDGSVGELVIFDDALSRTIDEEAWLQEFVRVIAAGGVLRLTLPAEGALTWLDPMNAYRYIADISGRGTAPDAALPIGWNRHYTQQHVRQLLTDANFAEPEIHGQNYAWQECRFLTGMLVGNGLRGDRTTELRQFPRFGRRDPYKNPSAIATSWSVTARKLA